MRKIAKQLPVTIGIELNTGLYKELISFPLKNNPFFAKVSI